jgi:glycerol kinase
VIFTLTYGRENMLKTESESSGSPLWERRNMTGKVLLALDQGTTSTRAIVFGLDGKAMAEASRPLRQSYPADGWVEHDADEIWTAAQAVLREALAQSGKAVDDVAAIGITNQRETVVVWDRKTGRPIHPAIVWQDRRTADACEALVKAGVEPRVTEVTGLLLDPYFSGTKIAWLLDKVPGARTRAERGELLAGTMDTWCIWKLTGGAVHATDATNASRTLLFDIEAQAWSDEMLEMFEVPAALLPKVLDCADDYGMTVADILGASVPIRGVAGDQQAALMGQGCIRAGEMKATYGTGCFMLLNTGEARVALAVADDGGGAGRRQDDLCPGGLDLRGRGGDPVAGRGAGHDRRTARGRGSGAHRQAGQRGGGGAGLYWPGRALVGR